MNRPHLVVIAGRPVTPPPRRRPTPEPQYGPRLLALGMVLCLLAELALVVRMDWLPW